MVAATAAKIEAATPAVAPKSLGRSARAFRIDCQMSRIGDIWLVALPATFSLIGLD
jgi:hypothetical protein